MNSNKIEHRSSEEKSIWQSEKLRNIRQLCESGTLDILQQLPDIGRGDT